MSRPKELIVEGERKREAAISVALEAGELKRCDQICGQVTKQHSENTLKLAYQIGNAWITKGDPRVVRFNDTTQDRKELSDTLHSLWTDFPNLM